MNDRRSYRQLCALAVALDAVGQRWTLLIVRNLLVGPQRYGELLATLPGITTNLLAKRLREMAADGLVRHDAEGRYALTPAGQALEPALFALASWGEQRMGDPGSLEHKSLRWAVLAMRRRFSGSFDGCLELRVEGQPPTRYVLDATGGELSFHEERPRAPRLVLEGPELPLARTLLSTVDPAALGVRVSGSRRDLDRFRRSVRTR